MTLAGITGCTDDSMMEESDFLHSPALSPEEELATFRLASGLRIELVASEPLVEDPITITFDEEGRLWVVEMRGFMPDIDGTNEEAPIGRIAVLMDDDGDGMMDRRTVFLDSLILPRALAIVQGGALVAENKPLWFVEDTDGDLVADHKTLIDSEYGGSGLPEHSANGLLRGLDNWYYNAKSRSRYRLIDGAWQQEDTEFRGQWGISQDDKGRLYYNYNWSQLHADLVPPNYLSRNPDHTPTSGLDVGLTLNRSIFPIRPNRAVNRGYIDGALDEEGRLREFTSAGAPLVFRGTALPAEYYGNVFVCEPAGNLIKRNIVDEADFSLTARFAYPDREFLASTDERFRTVNLASGPDGALYVVDMYRGLIQHGAYMTPYLREVTLERDLVLPVHRGRIWRIVPEDWSQPEGSRLAAASTEELVKQLFHPDGWHRDTAQRLLVERGDPGARPVLISALKSGQNDVGRLHALWTLEGLGVSDPAPFKEALEDSDPAVQAAALRVLEELMVEDLALRAWVGRALKEKWEDASPEFALQIALTAGTLKESVDLPFLADLLHQYAAQPIMRDAVMSGLEGNELAFLETLWASPDWQEQQAESSIVFEMLASSIVRGGTDEELKGLLTLVDQQPSVTGWRTEALLTSMSVHGGARDAEPVVLERTPVVLTSNEEIDTEHPAWSEAIKALFRWPGHIPRAREAVQTEEQNDQVRALVAQGRQLYLTGCAGCHGLEGQGLARFAPPLALSEWVEGHEERLVRVVLHGIEGPIEVRGVVYDEPDILTVMPAHSVLDDTEIASILTYIRQAWGNQAEPILPRTVGRIRHGSQGQVTPWTAEALLQLPLEEETP